MFVSVVVIVIVFFMVLAMTKVVAVGGGDDACHLFVIRVVTAVVDCFVDMVIVTLPIVIARGSDVVGVGVRNNRICYCSVCLKTLISLMVFIRRAAIVMEAIGIGTIATIAQSWE